jgi:hypothetical protein
MRLFEHNDFEQAVLQAAEHFRAQGLRPAIIEKDYYVTEALRAIDHSSARLPSLYDQLCCRPLQDYGALKPGSGFP